MSAQGSLIGSWTCPSGNSCDVFLRRGGPGLEYVDLLWDAPPPLQPADERFYFDVILPELHQRVAETLELPAAPAVYVRMEPAT
jgi:hypothetical protein